MGPLVNMGSSLLCTFGVAPSSLLPAPGPVTAGCVLAATIMDCAPIVNIPPFGMCSSPLNPAVLAATVAAMGVLTPMPCVPVPAGTWLPTSPTILIGGKPALDQSSILMCSWAGVISVTTSAQAVVTCTAPEPAGMQEQAASQKAAASSQASQAQGDISKKVEEKKKKADEEKKKKAEADGEKADSSS